MRPLAGGDQTAAREIGSYLRDGMSAVFGSRQTNMTVLTFQVLEGMERGRVLSDIQPPVTIGREEDNGIQLNDERVSRFHAKVQEDGGRVILTDLESTNGTRVNGHPIQMHVLRIGDQVSIGRCLLLYGSAEEIEDRVRARQSDEEESGILTVDSDEFEVFDPSVRDDDEELPRLFPDGAPELPLDLRAVQVAQLADLLAHLHDRLRSVIVAGKTHNADAEEGAPLEIDWTAWQRMLQLEMDIAAYLRELTSPGTDG